MRGVALKFQTELITEECCNCHMLFGMTREFYDQRHEKKGTEFFCPRGHSQHYTGESDAQRYKRMLDEANRKNTDLAERVMGANIAKGKAEAKAKRLLKRVRAGVCPHCQRTFVQLARHIECKHPEKAAEKKS
jgi:hypothetical protein